MTQTEIMKKDPLTSWRYCTIVITKTCIDFAVIRNVCDILMVK